MFTFFLPRGCSKSPRADRVPSLLEQPKSKSRMFSSQMRKSQVNWTPENSIFNLLFLFYHCRQCRRADWHSKWPIHWHRQVWKIILFFETISFDCPRGVDWYQKLSWILWILPWSKQIVKAAPSCWFDQLLRLLASRPNLINPCHFWYNLNLRKAKPLNISHLSEMRTGQL